MLSLNFYNVHGISLSKNIVQFDLSSEAYLLLYWTYMSTSDFCSQSQIRCVYENKKHPWLGTVELILGHLP
jgi:hypothetical protein